MGSHFSCLGFRVETENEFEAMLQDAISQAEVVLTGAGRYHRWRAGQGIELWVQTNEQDEIIGCNPRYEGSARLHLGLVSAISGSQTPLDGGYYAWNCSQSDDPENGDYPFVFDVADFMATRLQGLPKIVDVQVTAFAHGLRYFINEEAYISSQGPGRGLASQSFIPTGLFSSDGERRSESEPYALITGNVLSVSQRINPITQHPFYVIRMGTYGGEFDVVADPRSVQEEPETGGIIQGEFWLSGRILSEI